MCARLPRFLFAQLCVCVRVRACVRGAGQYIYPGFAHLGPLSGAAVIWEGVSLGCR